MTEFNNTPGLSFSDYLSLCRFRVKLSEKRVFPGRQGANKYYGLAFAHDDLFTIQFVTLKFFRRRVTVIDDKFDLGICGYRKLGRDKQVFRISIS